MNLTSSNKKNVLVVGSSRGIGFSITESLLDEGHTVFGASRSGTPIEHGNLFDVTTDITSERSVENLFEEISLVTPGIDLVVLSAGYCSVDPIVETSSSEFMNHLKTNVAGAFYVLKHLQPFLIQKKSHVVTLSSEMGKNAEAGWSAYSASKFALEGLLQSCEKEWESLGVRFTTLRPWAVDTNMWDNLGANFNKENFMSKEDFLEIFNVVINDKKSWIKNLNFNTHV